MSIIVSALAVVGGVIYILVVVLSYSNESAHLNQALDDLRMRLTSVQQRTTDYENRLEALQEELPKQHERIDRLNRWIDLLKGQKAQLEADKGRPKEMMDGKEREEAVLKRLTVRSRGRRA